MAYRALYRVFRPQTFGQLRGQDHISTTLKNALMHQRLAHAYLFCGPRGTGKTSSAKILAKAVNCLDLQQGEPCNQCSNCVAINNESLMDVIEIDAASNRGIDEMREIRDRVKFTPSVGKKKVYIIDEVHMLTNEAFNALLKTLEEPPEHVLFILATTDPQKIPLTILSRCQRFDFRKISTKEISQQLEDILASQSVGISAEALAAIARKASGGMRDAISVLDQCIAFAGDRIEASHVELVLGTLGEEDMAKMLEAIIKGDYAQMFTQVASCMEAGKDIKQVAKDLLEYSRQLLLLKVAPQEQLITLTAEMLPTAKAQAQQMSVEFLGEMIQRFSVIEKDLRYSNQPQILLETALVDMILLKINGPAKTVAAPVVQAAAPTVGTSQPVEVKPARKLIASEKIITAWPTVMEKIKKDSIRVHAFLQEGKPVGLEEGQLVIKFSYKNKFHYNSICQLENTQMIQKVLQEMTGDMLKIKPYLETEEGSFEKDFDMVQSAMEIFGADIVEVK